MKLKLIVLLLLGLPLITNAEVQVQKITLQPNVQNIGNLESLADNSLNGHVSVKSLINTIPLFGLGMQTGLDHEVLILDNQIYVGSFKNLSYSATKQVDINVSFLVYAHVNHWKTVDIPETIKTFKELEAYIPKVAQENGLDIEKPVPFQLQAEATTLKWFVVNGMGNLQPNPRDNFLNRRYLGGLDDAKIKGFGFYSSKHRGQLTNPNSNIHIHFLTNDVDGKALFVAHLDDNVTLKAGARLLLPMN